MEPTSGRETRTENTVLHLAVKYGWHETAINLFLRFGADVNATDGGGKTPLQGLPPGHVKVRETLIRHGSRTDELSNNGSRDNSQCRLYVS